MFTGDLMSESHAVVWLERIAFVNMIGPIDIELLTELSGKLSIPQIDIEREKKEDLQKK